jgi:hypothetical protein
MKRPKPLRSPNSKQHASTAGFNLAHTMRKKTNAILCRF